VLPCEFLLARYYSGEENHGSLGVPSGSHLIPAHASRCKFNNIVERCVRYVLKGFLCEKALVTGDDHIILVSQMKSLRLQVNVVIGDFV
jgi:hypothetical protein